MSFFLYKPHVEGAKGLVTTPDVIVDRVFIKTKSEVTLKSASLLTSSYSQQATKENKIAPLYALTALGGGIIISPGAIFSDGPINIARKAWRFNTISGHTENITLNDIPLTELAIPEEAITHAEGHDDRMPRGVMVICLGAWTHISPSFSVDLRDPVLSRSLKHNISIEMAEKNQWSSRPIARYSTGPTQRKVDHYI